MTLGRLGLFFERTVADVHAVFRAKLFCYSFFETQPVAVRCGGAAHGQSRFSQQCQVIFLLCQPQRKSRVNGNSLLPLDKKGMLITFTW